MSLPPPSSDPGQPAQIYPVSPPAPTGPPGRVEQSPGALPQAPCDYHQLLRGPRFHWWRPLLSLVLVVVFGAVAILVISGVGDLLGGGGRARPVVPGVGDIDDDLSPWTMATTDLMLAVLIPVTGLATWVGHRIRPRFVSSVAGGIRWRWLARCVLVLLPLFAVYLAVGFLTDPPAPGRPAHWVLLLVLAVVVTPFQAAGEEFLFRGWLTQNIGSYFSRPIVGLVVSTIVSAALFSLAHGSLDPWVLADIATLAVAACYANWRTGGLEAGIAMHLANNVLLGVVTITVGGYADSFVGETTTGSPVEVLATAVVLGTSVLAIVWQARRAGVQRRYAPPALIPAVDPYDPAVGSPTWYAPMGLPPTG